MGIKKTRQDSNGNITFASDTRTVLGLKKFKIAQMKRVLNAELEPTDWYVIRRLDRNRPIPEAVLAERAGLLTACEMVEKKITAATTLNELDLITHIIKRG